MLGKCNLSAVVHVLFALLCHGQMSLTCVAVTSSNADQGGVDAGVLGENLIIPTSITQTVGEFEMVNLGTLAFCLFVFFAILGYIRFRRLL